MPIKDPEKRRAYDRGWRKARKAKRTAIADDYLTVGALSSNQIERIFSKIEVDPVTECWNWMGGMFPHGYGSIFWNGRTEYTHRLLYAWLIAPLPRHPHKGKRRNFPIIDHLCRNRQCSNPFHLELTNQQVNILRGAGPCADNAKKTHCPYGHPLEVKGDRRFCRVCANAETRKRYHEDPERFIKKTLGWRARNYEQYKETQRKWRERKIHQASPN